MARVRLREIIGLALALASGGAGVATRTGDDPTLHIENAAYRIVVEQREGKPTALVVSRIDQPAASRRLVPAVSVLMTTSDPGYRAMSLDEEVVLTAGWKRATPIGHETELFAGVPAPKSKAAA